jgi:hypothetical protein
MRGAGLSMFFRAEFVAGWLIVLGIAKLIVFDEGEEGRAGKRHIRCYPPPILWMEVTYFHGIAGKIILLTQNAK